MNNDITGKTILQERLNDLDKNGRARPWKEKKRQNLNLVASYGRLKLDDAVVWRNVYAKYEPDVRDCACYLEFEYDKLKKVYFCKKRLCAMCNWRKSIKVFASVSKVMDVIECENPDIQPVFLTLTQRNCTFDGLEVEIKRIFDGFKRLMNNNRVKNQIVGCFRALEVTYSRKTDTWHPHIHVIMLFEKDYFGKDNKRYIDKMEWVRLWRLSMRLNYDPNVDIRAVRSKDGNRRKVVAEVAKYPFKDAEILTTDSALTDRLVDCLTRSLYKKRLFAFGGLMAKVAKKLKLDKPDEGDLVNVGDEDETVRGDVADVIAAYRWDFGLLDYIRVR